MNKHNIDNNSTEINNDAKIDLNYTLLLKTILKENDDKDISDIVYVDKAKRDFIIKFTVNNLDTRNCQISLIDEKRQKEPVAVIRYQINNNGIYIGYFITRYDYQGTGLGKYIYQLAQAHADMLKMPHSEGLICPVGKIKGVSNNKEDCTEKEYNFLVLMYHALGNKITKVDAGDIDLLTFNDNWKVGEKNSKLNKEQLKFIKEAVKYEKHKHNEYIHRFDYLDTKSERNKN